jgi:hypothetical protein
MQTMNMSPCVHRPVQVGRIEVVACPSCETVEWFRDGIPCSPDEGMAGLVGDFDLVGSLPALAAPANDVLLYKPPSRAARRRLEVFEPHMWWRVTPALWMCHDGEALLLAPTDPVLAHNLTHGA